MQVTKKIYFLIILAVIVAAAGFTSGCGVYSFRDVSIPDSIKTVRINYIENKATYVNPQLSPQLTEGVRRKIISQTRLTQTTNDDAHYDITGEIRDYVITTSGIANKQEVSNRLTVSVHIILNNQLSNEKVEFDVSRGFEFSATKSQQTAEAELLDEMIKSLSDDIFTRLFSNW